MHRPETGRLVSAGSLRRWPEDEFRPRTIATAFDYVQIIGNKTLHVMAGLTVAGVDRARQRAVYVNNSGPRCRLGSRPRRDDRDRADQHPRYSRVLPQSPGRAQAICAEISASPT